MKTLVGRYGKFVSPTYAKIVWVLIGIVATILAGGAPTGPAGSGG